MSLNLSIGLCVLAALFVLWPIFRTRMLHARMSDVKIQDVTQRILYDEHLADLDKVLAAGDLDQEQYAALKLELQRTLLADADKVAPVQPPRSGGVWVLVVLAIAVPIMAFALYNQWGADEDWEIYQLLQRQKSLNPDNQPEFDNVTKELVEKAKLRVESKPKSPQLLYLLASYSMANQDLASAENYYRKLLDLEPRSPQILGELAQTLFVKSQNIVTAEVRELTQGALRIAPNMPTPLSLAGIDEFQQGQYLKAIDYWTRALAALDPQTSGYRALQGGIEKAKQSLAAAGQSVDAPAVAGGDAVGVDVEVSLAPSVAAAPEDTVFIYARAWQGAKMPLAIQRFKVSDLPKKVRLDKTMAMAPGMDLTSAPSLEVLARISKSGSPMAASGDWQASSGQVTLTELKAPVVLLIDKQIP